MKQRKARKALSLLLTLCMVVGMIPAMTVTAGAADAVLGNGGYPYGKDMDGSKITLVMDAQGATGYQWQQCDSENGTFADISGATAAEYTFTPTDGNWYRCKVGGTQSKAVQAVKAPARSGETDKDGRTWTRPFSDYWYLSNGTMAYMSGALLALSGRPVFDVAGLYEKGGKSYMLSTSYDGYWRMTSSTEQNPGRV